METFITNEMLRSFSDGNFKSFVGYLLIFIFLWIEVRGVKKELITLNKTISDSTAKSEQRHAESEEKLISIDERVVNLEAAVHGIQTHLQL